MMLRSNQSLIILLTVVWKRGCPFKNKLWNILIRTRFRPLIFCAIIVKASLQVHIKEKERDSLKFHWVENLKNNAIQILRFTSLVFGLNHHLA